MLAFLLTSVAVVDAAEPKCWFPNPEVDPPPERWVSGSKQCMFPTVTASGESHPGCAPRKVIGIAFGWVCQTEEGGKYMDCADARNCEEEQSDYVPVPNGLIAANDKTIPPLLRDADNSKNRKGTLVSRVELMKFQKEGGGLGLHYCPPDWWPRKDLTDKNGRTNIRLVPGADGTEEVTIIGCYEKQEDDNSKCWDSYSTFQSNPCGTGAEAEALEEAKARCADKTDTGIGEMMLRCCPKMCDNLGPRQPKVGFKSEVCTGRTSGCSGECSWSGDVCVKKKSTWKNSAVSSTPMVAFLVMMYAML